MGIQRLRGAPALVAIVIVIAAGSVALTAGPAAASTPPPAGWCYGDYCSGMDPHTTRHVPDGNYCDADGTTVASIQAAGTGLLVELRWSSRCQANWARVPASFGSYSPGSVKARQCDTGYQQVGVVDSNTGYSWTAMIYSPSHPVSASWSGSPGNYATACV